MLLVVVVLLQRVRSDHATFPVRRKNTEQDSNNLREIRGIRAVLLLVQLTHQRQTSTNWLITQLGCLFVQALSPLLFSSFGGKLPDCIDRLPSKNTF